MINSSETIFIQNNMLALKIFTVFYPYINCHSIIFLNILYAFDCVWFVLLLIFLNLKEIKVIGG